MKIHERTLKLGDTRRWWISFPFFLALITLIFIGWTAIRALVYPHDGISNLRPTGQIREIDPFGPASNRLLPGDTILFVNGKEFSEALPFYSGKRIGDEVPYIINREGEITSVTIPLVKPPYNELFARLAPLLAALIYWIFGAGVMAFMPADSAKGIFFIFFQANALLLTSGAASYQAPQQVSSLYSFLLWMIGPIYVHFHLHFPQTTRIQRQRLWLALLYGVALLGGLPYLVWEQNAVRTHSYFPYLLTAGWLTLAINILGMVVLLIHSYYYASSPGVRGKIRIVVLGGMLTALPLIVLVILPEALQGKPIVPYAFAFLLVGVVPLTYGYAIFRHRLIEIEKHVNRGATYILLYTFLIGIYLVLNWFFDQILSPTHADDPWINTLLVLILATVFVPLHKRVKRLVDTVFYGGWYDYRSAVTLITRGLEQITELKPLAETVSERLVRTLHLEDACVFLRDLDGNFSVIDAAPHDRLASQPAASFPALPISSLEFLFKMGDGVGRSSLRKVLSQVEFSPVEGQLLNSEQDHLWIPIIGHGQPQGLLALGPKIGGDIFSSEDMDILRLVARQIGPVLENIHLLNQLRQHAADLEQRVKERTAELHDAKERVEAILASVGDGVIVTDLDGTIQIVNGAFEKQSGFLSTELCGETIYSLLEEQNAPEILAFMKESLLEGKEWHGDLVALRKGSSQYDIQLTMAPVRDQSGVMVSYVGSQSDITRKKELERLKDQFVADVSHELRTPTSNISLYLELLEDATPQRRSEFLKVIKEQNELLKKLVEDILDLSRLGRRKSGNIEFVPVNLNAVAEQVLVAHLPLADAGKISLYFEPDNELPPARGEENQLGRVITNLISNAIRYTPHGYVSVRTYRENGCTCLEVCDSGLGIDPDDLPHLFERFYRGKQVRQSKIHGTGLGLAIVKEIVEAHEGSIEVESKSGTGSVFRVMLPVYQILNDE